MRNPHFKYVADNWRRGFRVLGFLAIFAIVAIFVAAVFPSFVGADHSYVVQTDSMSPSIKAGAVVFVADVPVSQIQQDDVITFDQAVDGQRVTHRVIEVIESDGARKFVTQGDANEDPDPNPVSANAVVGTVAFHVPLMGYVVSFANTQLGLLTLIVIPALLLIILELRGFWREMTDEEGETQ